MIKLDGLLDIEMDLGGYFAKPISISDYNDVFTLMSNDLVRKMSAQLTLDKSSYSEWWKMRAVQRENLRTQNWVVRDAQENMLGLLTVKDIENSEQLSAEVGYSFLPAYWGKGLASKLVLGFTDLLFSKAKFDFLIAQAASTNIASNKVLLKCAYKFQRSFAEGIVFQGEEIILNEYIKKRMF